MNYNIKKYPDGSSYAKIERFDRDFSFRINSYEDLWHLKQITDTYLYNGLRPTITIPNLIDAQADRRFSSNESNGLKLVCEFLNGMYGDFKIFHPHNPEVVEALMNNVEIIDNSEFISYILSNHLILNPDTFYAEKELILMSSDAGGFKPLMKLCDKINWKGETYSASKARSWDENDGTKFVQQIGRKDFGGKDILIIDDISVYGGTFKGLAKILHECNVGKLYLAVSHITVQQHPFDNVFKYFDKVFSTNSKFDKYEIESEETTSWSNGEPQNLEIIKLF